MLKSVSPTKKKKKKKKNTNRNSKPGWEFGLETDKKSMTTRKKDKTEEKCWNMLERKEKSNTAIKTNYTT